MNLKKTTPIMILAIFLTSTSLVTGCATTGATTLANENQSTVDSKIIVGQTTQAQVEAMYGKPQNIKQSSTGTTYIYVMSSTRSGNILHGLDSQDLKAAADVGAIGVMVENKKLAALGAGIGILSTRTGQALNKSDEAVQKSLIIKFNKMGVVSSYSLN